MHPEVQMHVQMSVTRDTRPGKPVVRWAVPLPRWPAVGDHCRWTPLVKALW